MDSQLENEMLSSMSTLPPTSFSFFDLNIFEKNTCDGLAWSPEEHMFTGTSYGSQQSFAVRPSLLSSSAETCDLGPSAAVLSASRPPARDARVLDGVHLCPNLESCSTLALKTIETLHVSEEDCLSSEEQTSLSLVERGAQEQSPVRATDVVLAQNAEATSALHGVLKCACSTRPQLQMLVANILEKLVKWCGAIVKSSSTGSGSQQRPQGVEQVRRQSIAIGTHQLEGDLNVPIIAHVMMGRLQKLEDLVEMLSDRMEESNARMGSKNRDTLPMAPLREVGLLEIVRDRLIVCLKRQIGAVREDAVRLRQNNVVL